MSASHSVARKDCLSGIPPQIFQQHLLPLLFDHCSISALAAVSRHFSSVFKSKDCDDIWKKVGQNHEKFPKYWLRTFKDDEETWRSYFIRFWLWQREESKREADYRHAMSSFSWLKSS